MGDFGLTAPVVGWWDRVRAEVDLMAVNDESRTVRVGTCKRNPGRLLSNLTRFDGHIQRFLSSNRHLDGWRVEKVAIAPSLDAAHRRARAQAGYLPQDLTDLTDGFAAARPSGRNGATPDWRRWSAG